MNATDKHFWNLYQAAKRDRDILNAARVGERWVAARAEKALAWWCLGRCKMAERDYTGAAEAFELALAIDETLEIAAQGVGIVWLRLKNPTRALRWLFDEEEDTIFQSAKTFVLIGRAFFQQNEIEKAVYWYKKAIEIDPNYSFSYYHWAKVYLHNWEPKSAISLLQKAIFLAEKSLFYEGLGEAYKMDEQYAAAEMAYYKAVELSSTMPYFHLKYATYLATNISLDDAAVYIQELPNYLYSPKLQYLSVMIDYWSGFFQNALQKMLFLYKKYPQQRVYILKECPEMVKDARFSAFFMK